MEEFVHHYGDGTDEETGGEFGVVAYVLADHHGTGQLSVDAADQEVTHRRTLPFGGVRGDDPGQDWPGSRGFVGGIEDGTTGLISVGAREYDPALGRFVSLDPVMDLTDPQQIHGYAYAAINPLAFSDPTGLLHDVGSGIGGKPKPKRTKPTGKVGGSKSSSPPARTGGVRTGTRYIPPTYRVATRAITNIASGVGRSRAGSGSSNNKSLAGAQGLLSWGEEHLRKGASALARGMEATADFAKDMLLPDFGLVRDCAAGLQWGCLWLGAEFAKPVKPLKGQAPSKMDTGACNSFIPGTAVLLADGSSTPIEHLEIGDQVLATDPETGETTTRTVTAEIHSDESKNLVDITTRDSDGATHTLTTTDGHPFWVPETGEWTNAGNLAVGTALYTSDGGPLDITALTHHTTPTTIHNLTIADTHTYYVLAGATPVLVHNSDP